MFSHLERLNYPVDIKSYSDQSSRSFKFSTNTIIQYGPITKNI